MGLELDDDRPGLFRYGDGLSTFQLMMDSTKDCEAVFACLSGRTERLGLGESDRSLFTGVAISHAPAGQRRLRFCGEADWQRIEV